MRTNECVIPAPPTLPPIFGRTQNAYLLRSPLTTRRSAVECHWASQHDDVHKACVLAQVCTQTDPREYCIKLGVKSILQDGPTCGQVALAMLATGVPTAKDIFQVAKERQYTNHGEMFSASNMHRLAQCVFESIGKDYVNVRLHRGQLDCNDVRFALRNGATVLVAYPFFLKLTILKYAFIYM